MKIGILGGGLAGVSLAYFLQEKGYDVEVLEKEAECGGLCRSFSKNGFCFDLGGHIIFSKDQEILNLMVKMLENNKKKHYRNNKVWFKGRYVKYPFENGLSVLDLRDKLECVFGLLLNKHPEPSNFKEWIYYTFGNGLANQYLIPYNEKIWNCKTETMGTEWVGRVPKPPIWDVVKSALGINTEGYTHQLYFYYPLEGGIQSIIRAFESKLRSIINNYPVKSIKRISQSRWLVSNGKEEREYDQIISCMPIFDLVASLENVPVEVKDAVAKLKSNSLSVVMLGIDKKDLTDKFAIYVPQKDLLFHRICFHSYMGPWYTPDGKSSVVAEITTNPDDGVYEMTDQELIEHVALGLAKEGFINKKDVCESAVQRMQYGYVVHDLAYQKNTRIFKDYFRSINLPLCGRFAEFEYLNMDATIKHAMNLSGEIRQ